MCLDPKSGARIHLERVDGHINIGVGKSMAGNSMVDTAAKRTPLKWECKSSLMAARNELCMVTAPVSPENPSATPRHG